MVEEWIATAFALFQQWVDEEDVVDRLTAAGCPLDAARRIVAFLPLACARARLEGSGVTFSKMFRGTAADGTLGAPQPFSADPYWNAVHAFVEAQRSSQPAAVDAVAMLGAEFKAINKAALDGSKLSDLDGGDPILHFVAPDVEARPGPSDSSKPWWAFWR